jgi:hypothetical protein
MNDHSKKLNGKKFFQENSKLDKKIKMSRSIYAAETLEKDYEKILRYKKIISNKESLFFDSPKKSKTTLEFYSIKKTSDGSNLPLLNKGKFINPIIKTTSTHFFKNSIQEMNNKEDKLLEIQNSADLSDCNVMSQNQIIDLKTISNNNSSSIINERLRKHLFYSQTTNNFKNSNDKIFSENFANLNSK